MTASRRAPMPNTMLRDLLAEAAWTGDALARAVNSLGAEAGIPLRYGRSAVAHWLNGMCPRQPVPGFVAEAFTRRLRRAVSVADTGLAAVPPAPPPVTRNDVWEIDVASRLIAPRETGAGGPVPVASRGYLLAELAVPGWNELTGTRAGQSWVAESPERVERWHVQSATSMVGLFSDLDFEFGGGHARLQLASYLAATVAPWLRATATPVVRHELLLAASRLTYLCGFMFADDELHGAAQYYYLTTLRLAAEAGDRIGYAVTLRALSGQARSLGHHREAVRLAEAAVDAAGMAGPQTAAFLYGQLAVAHASDGNRGEAVRHLRTAERYLDRAVDRTVPIGGCNAASLAHQQAAVWARLGDRPAAIQALTQSVRHRPASERRSRAITLARLAELQFDTGHIEEACETWQRFLQDYPYLRSRRVSRALVSMLARLRPHTENAAVMALRQRNPVLSETTAISRADGIGH